MTGLDANWAALCYRFERELEALRKELAEATAAGYPGSGINTPQPRGHPASPPRGGTSVSSDPDETSSSTSGSPLVVGRDGLHAVTEGFSLDLEEKKNQ